MEPSYNINLGLPLPSAKFTYSLEFDSEPKLLSEAIRLSTELDRIGLKCTKARGKDINLALYGKTTGVFQISILST